MSATAARLHTGWQTLPDAARGGAVALGNMDGVHLGHAHVVATLHKARPDLPLCVLTFEPHPRAFFRPEDPPFRLMTPEMRFESLAALGVRHVFQIPFDEAFSLIEPEQFVHDVLHRGLGARHLACGPDFAFGHRRHGDLGFLARRTETLGIGLTVVPALSDAGGPLSSSRIRRLLQDGYPERAAEELGRPWSIRGVVAHGDKRGRLIGFPTANIPLGAHLEAARGVYAVTVRREDGTVLPGVANLGRRPTVNDTTESRLEVHLFDFDGDLYGQTLTVSLHSLLRAERRFDGLDALKAQIAQDAEAARVVLAARQVT